MADDEKFGCIMIDRIQVDLDEMSDEELAKIEEQIIKTKIKLRRKIDQKLEIVQSINDNENNESIEKVVRKMLEKQYQHSMIKAVRNIKKSRKLINTNEMQLEKFINEQAKKYGQSTQILTKDVQEYKTMLEEINSQLNKIKKSLMKEKEKVQNEEYNKILLLAKKREERETLKLGEIQQLKNDIIEARNLGIEIDKQIDQCTANLKDYIENVSGTGGLVVQNNFNNRIGIISKVIELVFNKICGAKKFDEIVIKSVKQKVDRMKNIYFPEILKRVQEDGIDDVANIIEKNQKNQNEIENIENIKISVKKEITTIIEKFKIIIDNGNNERKSFINLNV